MDADDPRVIDLPADSESAHGGSASPSTAGAAAADSRSYYRDLKSRSDIIEVARELMGDRCTGEVGEEVTFDCPHHASQSHRSLRITPATGLFNCFGCRLGGDVIQLVEFVTTGSVTKSTKGNVSESHREARDWLAQRAGMPVLGAVRLTPEERARVEAEEAERAEVFDAMTAYARRCHQRLMADPEVRAWVREKYGFGDDVLERYQIGFADDPDSFVKLVQAGTDPKVLVSTGLFTPSRGRMPWPFFKGRVTFPYWKDGRVEYVIGRKTPWTEDNSYEQAKYKKLPVASEQKHQHVSRHVDNSVLFGEDCLKGSRKRIVITEGITDAIAAQCAGCAVISPVTVRLKTADLQPVLEQLRRHREVVVVMDHEISGIGDSAALELATSLDRAGLDCRVAQLPLRPEQESARAQLEEIVGKEAMAKLRLAAPQARKAILEAAAGADPERVKQINELIERSKIDVCELFRTGGTREEFEMVLDSAREPLEVRIDLLVGDPESAAVETALNEVLGQVADLSPLLQEQCLKRIKQRTQIGLSTLRKQLEQISEESTREEAADGVAPAAQCGDEYFATDEGMFWRQEFADGTRIVRLANFRARISACLVHDDGVEEKRFLEIELSWPNRKQVRVVPAGDYSEMCWVVEQFGPEAVLGAGRSVRDRAREAIQLGSAPIPTRTIYTHLGWREIQGVGHCYLHAGGAIGPVGPVANIEVSLPEQLSRYILPPPIQGEALRLGLLAVLSILRVGPARLTFALLAGLIRVVQGTVDYSLYVVGPSGALKTAGAAVIQQFHGAGMDDRHLPGSWSSTGNSLESLGFTAKDALLVVDDFAPHGSATDVQRMHRDADRIFRAQGNQSGRSRLRADSTMQRTRAPRGMFLATGEDVPAGQSLQARLLVLEVAPGDIDGKALAPLQAQASAGVFASVMSSFLQYVAANFDAVKARREARARKLREEPQPNGLHRRMPWMVAELQAGFEEFLEFARVVGAIDQAQVEALRDECLAALRDAVQSQGQQVTDSEPTRAYQRLLQAALASGQAHLVGDEGGPPEMHAGALGWRLEEQAKGDSCWRARGDLVGWVVDEEIYLEPTAAFRAAQRAAATTDQLTISERTLRKRLREQGHLAGTSEDRQKLLVRKTLQGVRRDVLHLRRGLLFDFDDGGHRGSAGAAPARRPAGDPRGAGPTRSMASHPCPSCGSYELAADDGEGERWVCGECKVPRATSGAPAAGAPLPARPQPGVGVSETAATGMAPAHAPAQPAQPAHDTAGPPTARGAGAAAAGDDGPAHPDGSGPVGPVGPVQTAARGTAAASESQSPEPSPETASPKVRQDALFPEQRWDDV